MSFPHAGGGQLAGAGAPQMTGSDVFRVIRNNLWLIILLMAVCGVGGYFLNGYLLKRFPRYTAAALMQVNPVAHIDPLMRDAVVTDATSLAIEQKSQAQLIRSDELVNKIFQDPDNAVRQTLWFQQYNGDVEQAKRDLLDTFSVTPVPDTKYIQLSMTCAFPKDCQTIVDAMGSQHILSQTSVSRSENDKQHQALEDLRHTWEDQLNAATRAMQEKAVALNWDGVGTPGRLGKKEIELQELTHRQLDIRMAADVAKAAYDSLASQVARGETPSDVAAEVDHDQAIVDLNQRISLAQTDADASAINYGEEIPRVKAARAQVRALKQQLNDTRAQKIANLEVAVTEKRRLDYQEAADNLKSINESVDALQKELGALNNDMSLYLSYKDDADFYRQLLQKVENEQELLQNSQRQDDTTKISWATHPVRPETPSFPKLPVTLGVSLFAGLSIALGIAFLRELTDTSVKSPRDLQRVGQLTLLGMVPHASDDRQAASARLPLVIFDAPTSMMADQFRQIRTRLQYAASLDTTRSILISSPGPADGKTTVAANLAAGLALNGRRILLVDADFRRPQLHKIFELPNEHGFGDALQSTESFDNAVQATQVPNLSVMTCGVKPVNATELLESQLLIDFIDRVLQDFDHVIFDSGSVMVVSEAIALAPRVDGVVTVVRARSNSRGLLLRMRDALRQLKAEHLGVVLNAVRAHGGGYYGRNMKTYYAHQDDA